MSRREKRNAFRKFVNVLDSTEKSVSESAKVEVMTAIKILSKKMEDLQMCNDLIVKHGNSLQKSLSDLESADAVGDVTTKIKAINERATLFRIASSAMINVRRVCTGILPRVTI